MCIPVNATLCSEPAETRRTFGRFSIRVAFQIDGFSSFIIPNCPYVFRPQPKMLLSNSKLTKQSDFENMYVLC